ncbi:hypothetical protein BD324DRAFT_636105 [Kockovaella imperatae]|uniref:Uncharacterized protein n=1 Tax=Kockovaella imperatae TaxID=4999 RepID=A0A1Y1U8Y4_9TREE|nr:hypothetical protein BD324DRAFT_636105 [Kockovaella imperatae]ORX34483.1 hypothetical protein BD324DRAFT_636105 [Kockovaella imperatae]
MLPGSETSASAAVSAAQSSHSPFNMPSPLSDFDMSPVPSPRVRSRAGVHTRSHSWCAPSPESPNDPTSSNARHPTSLSSEMTCKEFSETFKATETPVQRVSKRRPTTRGKKRGVDGSTHSSPSRPSQSTRSRSRSYSKSISPKQSLDSVHRREPIGDTSISFDSDHLVTPAPQASEHRRRIAPLRSSRSSLFATGSTPHPISIPIYAYRDKAPSRDSSPVPAPRNDSSPLKKPRTSLGGEIINFHYSSDSDSENETPSPPLRTRARFNSLLGPSPLHKSFSSSMSPPSPSGSLPKSVSASILPIRATRTPSGTQSQLGLPFRSERSLSSPSLGLSTGNFSPNSDLLSPLRARTKILSEVEGLETELNKVFALVHGKGLGLGAGGRGRRIGSGLRQSKGVDDAEEVRVEDESPLPRRATNREPRTREDHMEVDTTES